MKTTTPLFKFVTLRPPMPSKSTDNGTGNENTDPKDDDSTSGGDNTHGDYTHGDDTNGDNDTNIPCEQFDLSLAELTNLIGIGLSGNVINNILSIDNSKLYLYIVYYYLSNVDKDMYNKLIDEYIYREGCERNSFISALEDKFINYIETFELFRLRNELSVKKSELHKIENIRSITNNAITEGIKQINADGKILVKNNKHFDILEELEVDKLSTVAAKKEIKRKIALVKEKIKQEEPDIQEYHQSLGDLHVAINNDKTKEIDSLINHPKLKSIISNYSTTPNKTDEIKKIVEKELKTTSLKLNNLNIAKEKLLKLENLEEKIKNEKTSKLEKYVSKNKKVYDALWKQSKKIIDKNTSNIEEELDSELFDVIDDFENNAIEPKALLSAIDNVHHKTYSEVKKLKTQISKAHIESIKANKKSYTLVGQNWVENEDILLTTAISNEENCNSKSDFVFSIADLRVVEFETVGYVPDEIAHINNTQPGEKSVRKTRRLKRVDSYESLLTEIETVKETDTKSTDRFSLEKAASEVENEQVSAYAGVKGSASFGAYKVSAAAGASYSNSVTNSNSMAQNISKEVVKKTLERVSKRIRTERSVRTIEEFEEKVSHIIDNTDSYEAKSYVYRWLNKLYRLTLKNYGKRLILELNVPNPASDYLSYIVKKEQQTVEIVPDPRKTHLDKVNQIESGGLNYKYINRENYLDYADIYKVKLKQAPERYVIASKSFAGNSFNDIEGIKIPDGYLAKKAYVSDDRRLAFNDDHSLAFNNEHLSFQIGREVDLDFINFGDEYHRHHKCSIELNNETVILPMSMLHNNTITGIVCVVEVKCEYSLHAYRQWQMECFLSIVKGYDNLKKESEAIKQQLSYEIPRLNPAKKAKIITDELKKRALDCMIQNLSLSTGANANTRINNVRKIENAYDWENMSYELHPYYYSDTKNTEEWKKRFLLTDDDPTFEAFLQASYATLRIPVQRNADFEDYALQLIPGGSLTNDNGEEISLKDFKNDLKEITKFETNSKGEKVAAPLDIDPIGTFVIPTDLVILEAGVENGVKLRSYPEKDEEKLTDVAIDKYYSPGIVSENKSSAEE